MSNVDQVAAQAPNNDAPPAPGDQVAVLALNAGEYYFHI